MLRGLRRLARNRDFFFQFSDFFVRRNYSYQVLITHKNFHDHLSRYEGTDRQTDYFSSIDINFRDYVKKNQTKKKAEPYAMYLRKVCIRGSCLLIVAEAMPAFLA